MLRTISSLLAISLFALPSEALAEDGGPRCMSLEKLQQSAGKDTSVAPLTAAQFHFLQGVYVVLPNTPDRLPPGDGALLLTKDKGGDGLVVWTLGPLACEPMAAPEKLMKYLDAIKAGVGEGDDS